MIESPRAGMIAKRKGATPFCGFEPQRYKVEAHPGVRPTWVCLSTYPMSITVDIIPRETFWRMYEEVKTYMKKGDWVADRLELERWPHQSTIGRVQDVYSESEGGCELLFDLVLYDRAGDHIGRSSPAMGGTQDFEPCLVQSQFRCHSEAQVPASQIRVGS